VAEVKYKRVKKQPPTLLLLLSFCGEKNTRRRNATTAQTTKKTIFDEREYNNPRKKNKIINNNKKETGKQAVFFLENEEGRSTDEGAHTHKNTKRRRVLFCGCPQPPARTTHNNTSRHQYTNTTRILLTHAKRTHTHTKSTHSVQTKEARN